MKNSRGFTLIEVMVALVIISMALPALMMRMSTMSTSSIHARDVTIAYWVAENKMQEVRLTEITQGLIPRGRQNGDVELAGVMWDWQIESKEIQNPLIGTYFQIWVRVNPQSEETSFVEDEAPMVELTSYFVE